MLEILLGQIPEAIFFSLFMIYAKKLKEKRVLFILLMTLEYLFMINLLNYNIWFQILYTTTTFLILKMLYKEKSQITDIFIFMLASLIVIAFSFIGVLIATFTFKTAILASIIKDILMILFLVLFKIKIKDIQKVYKKHWNRNNKVKKKMKSVTFRSINIVIFNLMFYILNLGIIYWKMNGGV